MNDLIRKDVEVDGEQVTLEIWDTAGQERFNAICSQFYRGADCVVLVFDTTNSKSFERLEYWRNQFLENGMPSDKSLFPVSFRVHCTYNSVSFYGTSSGNNVT